MFRRTLFLVLGLILAVPASSFAEPTVQASNIIFKNVAGRSMRISWTRGDGDGSIVTLREDPPNAGVDPADGDDYTANPDYTLAPELPVNSQNFVVYKGTGSLFLISGLVKSTSYSISIYEYEGTGASTDYLQLNPAEASQTTTNTPVHNDDNRIDCSDCHNHGTFGARDTELKAVCETCHNPSGVADTKLEFDNHTTPTRNTNIDLVDCGMCHELHNLNVDDTTVSYNDVTTLTQNNKSFLRANVNKYVSTSSPPAYLHTDQPLRQDPHPDGNVPADNPDRAVEDGDDLTATGYCQVCHSKTDYHRSTDTTLSDQCHDGGTGNCGPAETHCGACHEHNNKFDGAGDCTQCHSSVQGTAPVRPVITDMFNIRTSSHVRGVTEGDCLVCHDHSGHQSKTVRLLNADDGATSYPQLTPGASTLATGEGEQFADNCMSCHDDGNADFAAVPISPFSSPGSGNGEIPDITPPAVISWDDAAHNRPVLTSGSSPVTCIGDGTNGCHGSGHGSEQNSLLAPADVAPDLLTTVPATVFCLVCHDGNGPSSLDIEAQFDTGTNFQTVAEGGAPVNQRHDVTKADQNYSGGVVTCKDCHRPHEDATEEIVGSVVVNNPVGNPDTGAALAVYSIENSYAGDATGFTYYDSTVALDPTNPDGGTSIPEPDYVEFCLVCHDGVAPAGVTMPGAMLNMADSYRLNDQHGRLDGTGSASRGYLKQPWSTLADYEAGSQPGGGNGTYAALNCTLCHGAHGSGNVFNLRTSITVNGQPMTVGGKEAFMDPALCTKQCGNIDNSLPEFGTTSYFLPVQENLSWGAWCTFCHEPSHGTSDGTGCQSGHLHGGGNF